MSRLSEQEQAILSVMVSLNIIGEEIGEQLGHDARLHGCQTIGEYLTKSGFLRRAELRIIEIVAEKKLSLEEGKRQLLLSSERHNRAKVYKLGPTNPPRPSTPPVEVLEDEDCLDTVSGATPPTRERPPLSEEDTQGRDQRSTQRVPRPDDTQKVEDWFDGPQRLTGIESSYREGIDISGRQLGKYILLRPIGRGATSRVFLANHRLLNFTVALKVLHTNLAAGNPGFLSRFKREALLLMKLSHPSIVRVMDFDLIDGYYVMAMDYVDGISVGDFIDVAGWLREATVLRIACDVVEALRAAYKVYIVHRDIKPSNIMMTADGLVRLTDFGLARWVNASQDNYSTRPLSGLGTPFYCAPEQMEDAASVDFRADLYSLGATLYHMLAGRPPFVGTTRAQVLRLHRRAQPSHPRLFNPAISEETGQLVLNLLEKKPENRPASHLEVLSRLHANLHNLRDKLQDTDYSRTPTG